jgi:cleavage stimulation factor subunit 1
LSGKFVATGSADTSIKLLDVGKMKSYNQNKSEHGEDFAPARPVIRTFYDHTQVIEQ